MSGALSIRPRDLAIVQGILAAHLPQGCGVWVFGSRAKGTTKRGADLDLAVEADRPLSRQERNTLADAFEESDLPYAVDVVDMRSDIGALRAVVERDRIRLPR